MRASWISRCVTCVAVALPLSQTGCSFLFTSTVSVEEKEEIRLPPPEFAPVFNDPPRHDAVPGKQHGFGSALAAGHFTRQLLNRDDLELAVGVPGANDGDGNVVRFIKPAAGGEVIENILPVSFVANGDKGRFGAALAAGDFDADGFDDLAIGIPDYAPRGMVGVLYGGPPRRSWLEPPLAAAGTRGFGTALAAGDLDGDGADDLVIGEPGSQRAGAGDAGRIWVLWGRPGAMFVGMDDSIAIEVPAGQAQGNDTLFGASLAIGNFVQRSDPSRPILRDIAVGAPAFDHEAAGRRDVGRVYVFAPVADDPRNEGYAIAVELEPANGWELYAKSFGFSLAAGNFNDDRGNGEEKIDLAIGAPRSSIPENDGLQNTFSQPSGRGKHPEAGLVFVAAHATAALSPPLHVLSQDRMGLSQKGDNFGWALAAGDFNSDGIKDLAIGSPNERMAGPDVSGAVKAGAVYFRFGHDGQWNVGGGIPQIPVSCFDYIDAVRGETDSHKSDRFGSVLLATRYDAGTATDLVVGAPEADVDSADGVVRDAGKVWIGLNQVTEPGPFDGTFRGPFRDDACGGDQPATIEMIIHNREEAVCGTLTSARDLCFEVGDEEAEVHLDVRVLANDLGGSDTLPLEYVLRDARRRSLGTLHVDAQLAVDPDGPDDDEDLSLDLCFDGRGPARRVDRCESDVILERQ